jgi:5,10-methenyltetrahydrofolate synthetase
MANNIPVILMKMKDWQEWRKLKRAELMQYRESITAEDHRAWSGVITTTLEQSFLQLQRSIVGFCWPYRGECDPRPAMNFLHAKGATLALPEISGDDGLLQFRKWWPEAPMRMGAYAIPVPDNTELLTVDAIIIPLVGFDQQGYRLGYGGGYFDRMLATAAPRPLTIGIAFENLRLDSVHPQPHDIAMNFIVTEARIYRVTDLGLVAISSDECAAEHPLK